jgi:hypothetical protein
MRGQLRFCLMMSRQLLERVGVFSQRGARVRFVGILAVLMVLTLVQTFFPFIREPKLDEHRKLAEPPHIVEKLIHGNGRLAGDINAWFDDRAGFRSFLTRLSNQIDYSAFAYSKRVVVGKDGWLFDRNYFAAAIASTRSGEQFTIQREKMLALSEFMKRRNIRLIVISTPAKETLYREFLPSEVPQLPAVSEFQKFTDFLKAGDGNGWSYIDSQDIFRHLKWDAQLYFRTDLHATTYGSLVIAKELVRRIAGIEGAGWQWNPKLNLLPSLQPNGSDFRFIAAFSEFPDKVLELPVPDMLGQANPGLNEVFEKSPPQPFETIFHNEADRRTLPRTLLFGSSFLDRFLMIGAYSNFNDVYRVRGTSDEIGAALKAIPPGTRYFVYQFWEPHFSLLRAAEIPAD